MSGSNNNSLSNASGDANQNMSPSPAAAPSQSCGAAPAPDASVISKDKKSWIAIQLVDQNNRPVPGETYRIKLPDGSTVEDDLDKNGSARITGIDAGTCQVSFPNLDKTN
jgi:hypothetical protein